MIWSQYKAVLVFGAPAAGKSSIVKELDAWTAARLSADPESTRQQAHVGFDLERVPATERQSTFVQLLQAATDERRRSEKPTPPQIIGMADIGRDSVVMSEADLTNTIAVLVSPHWTTTVERFFLRAARLGRSPLECLPNALVAYATPLLRDPSTRAEWTRASGAFSNAAMATDEGMVATFLVRAIVDELLHTAELGGFALVVTDPIESGSGPSHAFIEAMGALVVQDAARARRPSRPAGVIADAEIALKREILAQKLAGVTERGLPSANFRIPLVAEGGDVYRHAAVAMTTLYTQARIRRDR